MSHCMYCWDINLNLFVLLYFIFIFCPRRSTHHLPPLSFPNYNQQNKWWNSINTNNIPLNNYVYHYKIGEFHIHKITCHLYRLKTWIGNSTVNADNKSMTTEKNYKTEWECLNMLGRTEKSNTSKKNIYRTRGNKPEGIGERRKTKKILKQDKTIPTKQDIPKQRKYILGEGECVKTYQQLDDKEAKRFWSKIWEMKRT